MRNLLDGGNFGLVRVLEHFATLVVKVPSINDTVLIRHLTRQNVQIVLFAIGSVGSGDDAVDVVVVAGLYVWQELPCQCGPFECVADEQVIQKRRILFPNLVLVVDELLQFHFSHCVAKVFFFASCTFLPRDSKLKYGRRGYRSCRSGITADI